MTITAATIDELYADLAHVEDGLRRRTDIVPSLIDRLTAARASLPILRAAITNDEAPTR
jgi:hypothetical protein